MRYRRLSREESRAAEYLDRYRYAENFRQQYDLQAEEDYKLWMHYRPPLPKGMEGRSNLHIPRITEIVDTIRARILKTFFGGSRPYIDYLPLPTRNATPEIMIQNSEKAELSAALNDMQLEKNGIVEIFSDYVTSFLVLPAGIMEVGWEYADKIVEKPVEQQVWTGLLDQYGMPITIPMQTIEQVKEVTVNDNKIRFVDYNDFYVDPFSSKFDEARFCFVRRWMTGDQLDEHLEWLHDSRVGRVYPIDLKRLQSTGESLQQGRWARQTSVGLTPETSQGYWPESEGHMAMYEVLDYWQDDRHAIMVNREAVAYEGENPFDHGKKPFVFTSFDPLPGELYGRSCVRLLSDLQHELNTTRNQRIDSVSWAICQGWKVKRDADIDETELVRQNHQVIHVDSPDEVIPIEHQEVPVSAFTEESIIKQDMEGVVGTPPVVRGSASTTQKTATESMNMVNAASIRFDVRILFTEMGVKRLAMLMDKNNQQFIDDNRLIRLFGKEGVDQWRIISPEDISGEWDYRPAGTNSDPSANKEIRRAQLAELYQMAIKTGSPYIDSYELTKMLLESYDIRNVEKILMNREQAAQKKVEETLLSLQTNKMIETTAMQQGLLQPPQAQITPEVVNTVLKASNMVPEGGAPVGQQMPVPVQG